MKPRVGVSACLLGEQVRWDGGHKKHAFVVSELASRFELVAVCPELELGLGVPREPIELVRAPRSVRLVGRESGRDLTRAMRRFAEERISALPELSGYVLKSQSPSCGLRVAIRGSEELGAGLFAAALVARFPGLPVVEEDQLGEDFVRSVLAFHEGRETPGSRGA